MGGRAVSAAGVVLRQARPEDAAAIARVHVATWRAAYAGVVPDAYLVAMTEKGQARQWGGLLGQGLGQGRNRTQAREGVLVAESPGGVLVGFGSCGRARAGTLSYRGEVFTLYVDVDWQNRGIGRALLVELFRTLLDHGLPDALIWVLSANPSRYFYEALGGRVGR